MATRQRKQNGPIRYAIYTRCSSEDQAEKEYSTLDAQKQINEQYVREKRGTLVKSYSDEGKSGTNLKRPGLQALLRDAEQKMFDVVVVTFMSRLGRGKAFTVAEYLLAQCAVAVETVKEAFADDMGGHVSKEATVFTDGILCKQVSMHTRAKQEQMVASGFFCGGQPPIGYQKQVVEGYNVSGKEPPKRLVIDAREAEVVRHCFNLFLERQKIAAARDYLKTVTGRFWDTTKTRYLLTNESYIGHYTFGQLRKENAHPAIIDIETWQAVQSLLGHVSPSRSAITHDYTYYLRGLVHCPHCGCPFTNDAAKGGSVRYYGCLHHLKRKTKCPIGRINSDALHAAVLGQIARAASHQTVMHRLIADSQGWQGVDETKRALRGQLAKRRQYLEMQQGNYLKAIGEGKAVTALLTAVEKTESELQTLATQQTQLEEEIALMTIKRPTAAAVADVWKNFLALWEKAEEDERAELMGCLVERVEMVEKNVAAMRLSPIAGGIGQQFGTNCRNRALFRPIATNPDLLDYPISFPRRANYANAAG